jgi:hypothetical protein
LDLAQAYSGQMKVTIVDGFEPGPDCSMRSRSS